MNKDINLLADYFMKLRFYICDLNQTIFLENDRNFEMKMHNACPYLVFKDFMLTIGEKYYTVNITDENRNFTSSDFENFQKLYDLIMKWEYKA